jgi:hypothetical protein
MSPLPVCSVRGCGKPARFCLGDTMPGFPAPPHNDPLCAQCFDEICSMLKRAVTNMEEQ